MPFESSSALSRQRVYFFQLECTLPFSMPLCEINGIRVMYKLSLFCMEFNVFWLNFKDIFDNVCCPGVLSTKSRVHLVTEFTDTEEAFLCQMAPVFHDFQAFLP